MNTNYHSYHCNSCTYCDFCNYCDYCDYSKNLRMTEYNTFCFSLDYNDENSFQQKRYRVFNTEVGKDRYYKLLEKINNILSELTLEMDKNSWEKEWEKVTQSQWQQLISLAQEVRGDNFKEGFEFITGVKVKEGRR